MKSWMEEKSFPIVTLKRLKGPEKDLILAKQESFLEHKLRPLFNDKPGSQTVGNKSSEEDDYKEWQKISGRYIRGYCAHWCAGLWVKHTSDVL